MRRIGKQLLRNGIHSAMQSANTHSYDPGVATSCCMRYSKRHQGCVPGVLALVSDSAFAGLATAQLAGSTLAFVASVGGRDAVPI